MNNILKLSNVLKTYFHFAESDEKNVDTFVSEHYEQIVKRSHCLRICVEIMVKNQANIIADTISNISDYTDEILIADTGSTDSTISTILAIADNNSKIHLIQLPWIEDYALMRNTLNSYSHEADWILVVDSDELFDQTILTKDMYRLVIATFDIWSNKSDISIAFRQTYTNHQISAWPERMFKQSKTIQFWGYVHEELRSANSIIHVKSKLTVSNLGTTPEQANKFNKFQRYYELSLKNISLEPNNPKWTALEPFELAVVNDATYQQRILNILSEIKSSSISSEYEPLLRQRLISIYIRSANLDDARRVLAQSLIRFPSNSRLIFDKHYLQLINIQQQLCIQLSDLKKDIHLLNNSDQSWSPYNSSDGLEEVLIKLLIKTEHYQLAQKILNNRSKSVFSRADIMLTPEINWISNIQHSGGCTS